MAANGVNQLALQVPLIFNGYDKVSDGSLSPKDFIRELKSRKAVHKWSDADTFIIINSSFRKQAAIWYGYDYVMGHTAEEVETFSTVFATFEAEFKRYYKVEKDVRDSLNWTSLSKQMADESVSQYISRLSSSLIDYYYATTADICEVVPVAKILLNDTGTARVAAYRAQEHGQAHTTELKTAMAERDQRVILATRWDMVLSLAKANVRTTLVNGLRDTEMRRMAFEYSRTEQDIK
jgi:hypothetical protein